MAPRKKLKATSKTALLAVIAQLAPLYQGKPPRELVARRAGYGTATSPAFKMALKRAAKRGHMDIVTDKTTVELTESGREEAGDASLHLASNEETHEKIKLDLSAKMNEVFELVKDGQPRLRSAIAATLGYKSEKEAGFKMLLNRIRNKGYLDFIDKQSIQLSDICFPTGRPAAVFT